MRIRKKIITLCAIALLSINVFSVNMISNHNYTIITPQDSSHTDPM